MSALTIRIPESLHQNLKALAEREGVSANQFIASAVAEKMASVLTLNYLKSEAAQAKRADFEAFLDAVPNTPVAVGTDRVTD
ncbi:YlcI/YnfO family protein [Methylophilus aquaticus]|uniref:YlcI/YnfO family protein n=1 Tax=Methylophilus aquaticus TaxID=1971610 RepID=A0ABT9JUB8_9PROT|nr:YlcI/YnfO family protein [Methylophilus aquaticus]MDP8568044.1 YlcI/YnfO family protein [Methylophilus aquaticus]